MTLRIELSKEQVNSLARPLVEIVKKFYENPENRKEYEKWQQKREKETKED